MSNLFSLYIESAFCWPTVERAVIHVKWNDLASGLMSPLVCKFIIKEFKSSRREQSLPEHSRNHCCWQVVIWIQWNFIDSGDKTHLFHHYVIYWVSSSCLILLKKTIKRYNTIFKNKCKFLNFLLLPNEISTYVCSFFSPINCRKFTLQSDAPLKSVLSQPLNFPMIKQMPSIVILRHIVCFPLGRKYCVFLSLLASLSHCGFCIYLAVCL